MNKIREAQRAAARGAVKAALKEANGRIPDAAKLCGISRQAMATWCLKLNIDPDGFRIKAQA